ncbi:MAG: DUF433 domain-containing protein [Bryobacteraceae bacterium]
MGVSEEDLLRSYPDLRAEDLANAWAYVRSHRMEIEEQIHDNEGAWWRCSRFRGKADLAPMNADKRR